MQRLRWLDGPSDGWISLHKLQWFEELSLPANPLDCSDKTSENRSDSFNCISGVLKAFLLAWHRIVIFMKLCLRNILGTMLL